ncbi:hypothetical protein MN116_001490, partial [Schistosoma mekongi]
MNIPRGIDTALSLTCVIIILTTTGIFEIECDLSGPVYYYERQESRYFTFSPGFYDSSSLAKDPAQCIVGCSNNNFIWSAISNDSLCFCGMDLPPSSELYNLTCPDSANVAVYASQPAAYLGPFEITTQNQTTIQVGEKIFINFVIPTAFQNLPGVKIYEFDYGDSIQVTENISSITVPLVISYNSPGPVWPTLKARNQNGTITGSASLALMIYEAPTQGDSILNCPLLVMQGSVFTCQFTCNKGSHLQGTLSFANDWQEAISLPEPNYDWIRLPPRRMSDKFTNYATNNLIITGTQARYGGTISTIQIHAVLLTKVTFYLLRVQCTVGTYNFEINGCSSATNHSITCATNQIFSGLVRDCVNVSSTDCGNLRQLKLDSPTIVENYNYLVVGIYAVELTVLGWQSITLPSVWIVEPGDRIGFTSLISGSIGCASSGPYEAKDLESLTAFSGTNGSVLFGSGLKRLTNMRHQIGAWIRPFNNASFTGYINTTGYQYVSLQLYSYWGKNYTSLTTIQTTILIDEPINETQLVLSICASEKPCSLKLKNHTGYNVTYVWNFGDGSPLVTTSDKSVQHVYTTVGNYSLIVNISNILQYKIIVLNVTVIQKLEFYEIQGNPSPTINESTTLKLNITGDLFICSWYLNNVLLRNDSVTQVDYIHVEGGVKNWNVICITPAESISRNMEQQILEDLTGLSLVTNNLQVARASPIVFTFVTGKNLTAQLNFSNQNINTSIDYIHRTITSDPVIVPQVMLVNYSLLTTSPGGQNLTVGQIQFDVPVFGMSIQVQPNYVRPSENMIFHVSFQEGTSIILTVDYGDGEVIQQSAERLQTWPSGQQLTKKYVNVSVYTVKFSASSGGVTENKTVNVHVIGPIGDYIAMTDTEFSPVKSPLTLNITRQSGNPAALAKITLDWGDNSQFTLDDFTDGNVYKHIYNSEGNFIVSASITNPVDQKVIMTTLKMRARIENFGCQLASNPIEKGKLSVISVVYKSAQNVVIKAFLNNQTDLKQFNVPTPTLTEVNYIYSVAGLYYEVIQAMNIVSNETCSLVVDVRNKIENVNITYGGHAIYPPGSVNFTIAYTGLATNFPTLAKYIVVWGDGSAPTEGMLTLANQPEIISHTLTDLNYFQASVTLDNVVSNMTRSTQVAAFGIFQQVDLEIRVAATGDLGYGVDENVYPLGVPLKIQVLADGKPNNVANITYLVINKSNNVTLDSAVVWNNYFLYTFTQFGEYKIVVLVSNLLSSKSAFKEIAIRTSLRGLQAYLVGNGVLRPSQQGIVRILFEAYPNDACLCITKSDGIGSVYYPKITDPTSICPLCPGYLRLQDTPVNQTFLLNVQYASSGPQYVFIQAMNPSKMVDSKLYIPVTSSTCLPPTVFITNTSSQLTNYPIKATTSEIINIEAILTVPDCLLSVSNGKLWTLYSIDPDTIQTLAPIQLSQQLGSNTLRLSIPANFLTPGTYKATCSVYFTPPREVPYLVLSSAYIIISPPPLLIQFDLGNPISKTIDLSVNEICLRPEDYSIDPSMNNVSAPQGIGSWIWYCKQAGEELSGSLVSPKPPGYPYSSVYTGCFGDGPGVIDTNNGTLCFSTENFRVNTTYEFTVIGSKPPNRTGRSTMQLVTTSSIAPTFSVKWFIIDSDDLYVTTFMESGTLSSDMLINWDIREMYPDGSLLAFNQTRQDAYTKGTLTPSWYINKEYFINRSDNVSGCVICATLSKMNQSGTSCLRFEYLPRPTPGICTYTLENTKMCVDCLNFTSTVSPLKYTFYLMNSSINLVLVSGNLSKICFTVPYMQSPLDACVQVSDKFGGSIEVCYAYIFIQPEPLEVIRDTVQSLADKNDTVLNRLVVTGQLSASAALVTSYASTVHMFSTLETLSNATINRDLRSSVIQQLVNVVNNFIPTDSCSFILTTSSVKEILVNTLDVDRSSQSKLNTYLMNMTQSLKTITFDSTIKLLEVTGTVFESALLLAEAGNKQINNPISLDIPKDPAALDYNVDLEKAGLQTSGLDPMFDLMLQNSAEQQSLLVSQTLDVIDKVMNTAQHIIQDLLTQGAPPITFQTSNGVMSLYKIPPSDLSNKISVETDNETNVFVNNLCDNFRVLNKSCSEPYSLQTFVSATNLFTFRTGSPLPIPSDTQTISVIVYDTDPVTIQNAKEIIEVTVHRSLNFKQPMFTSMDPGTNRPQLPAIRIAVDKTEVYQALLVSHQIVPNDVAVVFQLFPENIHECPQYLLFLRLIDPPVISLASGGYDMWATLPEDTSQCVNMTTNPNDPNYRYTFMLDNRQLMNLRSAQQYRERVELLQKSVAETIYIGFRQLNQYEINEYKKKYPPSIPYLYRDQINNTALSRWFLTSCLSGKLDSSKQWSTNKCRVGPMTTVQQTQCICDELSTITSGWFELPNTIDFNYIFANMDFSKNPTLYATEISVGILFLLIYIWARREDIKDIDRLSVTQLAENNPDHEYLYEIIVSTGHRRCAGTDSKVCFILSGQNGETGCRVLQDPNRKVLCRGSTDRFLLACPKPLGPLIYIRLWHDNSGVGDKASWYCNYVGVVDLQTREKSHFIVESWFAVEEDDGQ